MFLWLNFSINSENSFYFNQIALKMFEMNLYSKVVSTKCYNENIASIKQKMKNIIKRKEFYASIKASNASGLFPKAMFYYSLLLLFYYSNR